MGIFEDYQLDEEGYINCSDIYEFRKFCRDRNWSNEYEFLDETNVKFEDLRDKWFFVIYGIVFLK